MSLILEDYQDFLDKLDSETREILFSGIEESRKYMSPAGLRCYLEGAKAIYGLGRGSQLLIAYIQKMPAVAKIVGENAIPDLVTSVIQLSSLVSGGVLSALYDSLPTVALRLGDAEPLRQYLAFIHQLAAKAPRAIRPMLQHIDELLGKLTLSGLKHWAFWGANAHSRDLPALEKYFTLTTSDSLAILQRERRGTLFVDIQRKIYFYMRALWGREFAIRPFTADRDAPLDNQPYIEFPFIFFPDAYDDHIGQDSKVISGVEIYRAASAHATAHYVYTRKSISAEGLNPVKMMLIGLFEDARIENLMLKQFPGIKRLWLQFHTDIHQYTLDRENNRPQNSQNLNCNLSGKDQLQIDWNPLDDKNPVELMQILSLGLLDDSLTFSDALLQETISSFRQAFNKSPEDNRISWESGIDLFNNLIKNGISLKLSQLKNFNIPYRDDNRHIWSFTESVWLKNNQFTIKESQVRRKVSLMEMIDEVDCELAGDDAQEIWTLETAFYLDQEQCTINELEGKEPQAIPDYYDEWDYKGQYYRPQWTTVYDRKPTSGDPESIDQILRQFKGTASRLKNLIEALQPRNPIRKRRQDDGDEIDLDAAIRAFIEYKMGEIPDSRIHIRNVRLQRDYSILVLLDLSESTNDKIEGSTKTINALSQEAVTLLAWAIDKMGDSFAIHGFSSNGRHDISYYRFKDFNQPYNDLSKSLLAGMTGSHSTRMGAALRHGGRLLKTQSQRNRLLLVITDGEPADIDVTDSEYLHWDARKAVEELEATGISSYCLTLDFKAGNYVSRIFGNNRYTILDNVERLPERLPELFINLTKH